jgi:enoyl-CoA hydratase/carnithine racemase
MELLMSAKMLDANEAKELGLVNYVTAPDSCWHRPGKFYH